MSAVEKSNSGEAEAGAVGGGVGVAVGVSNEKPVLAGASNENPVNGASCAGGGAGFAGSSNEKPGGGVTALTGAVSVENGDFGGGAGDGVGTKWSSADPCCFSSSKVKPKSEACAVLRPAGGATGASTMNEDELDAAAGAAAMVCSMRRMPGRAEASARALSRPARAAALLPCATSPSALRMN